MQTLYTLMKRRLKSGRVVYYFRARTPDGRRATAKSTGKSSKIQAHAYCQQLLREGRLLAARPIYFGDFAANFWLPGVCPYRARREDRGAHVSGLHADISRSQLERHILPVFAKRPLAQITAGEIDRWLQRQSAEGLAASTLNHHLSNLRIVLQEAVREGLIDTNPAANVQGYSRTAYRPRDVPTPEELRTLLAPEALNTVWRGDRSAYAATLIALVTGARAGEIIALRWADVDSSHLVIRHSWCRKYGLKSTKGGKERMVPIPGRVTALLATLRVEDAEAYVLSGTRTPRTYKSLIRAFRAALAAAGVPRDAQIERRLSFHSLRHAANSLLRIHVPDNVLRQVVGHSSADLTEHYSHTMAPHLQLVREAQEKLLPETAG